MNPAPVQTSLRRLWAGAFAGFFLIFAGWAFAAPYDGPPDEVQHVIRAAGVVSGQVAPEPAIIDNWDGRGSRGLGAYQRVPEGLHSPATCWGFDPNKPANCATPIHGGPVSEVPTSAGRYNPTYYALVGLPVRLWPGWGGLVLSRLISAALSAALLACAFAVLVRWSRFGLMLGGLVAASTPMLAHLAGAVNPNGLEISAGIALFAAGIPMLLDNRMVADRRALYWLFGISAVLLALVRPLGPLWLVCALAALGLGLSRARLGELWATKPVRNWALAIGAALLVSVAWTLIMRTGNVVPPDDEPLPYVSPLQAALTYFEDWNIYFRGMVGAAGWFDIFVPSPFYWLWISFTAALLLFALAVGRWTDRWRFFPIFLGGFVAPGVMQVAKANVLGLAVIGGRYMLPLLVGIPLLAAFILDRSLMTPRLSRTMTRLFLIALLPVHVVLLVYAMIRWQRGRGNGAFNFLRGEWQPPTGSLLPMLLMVAGLVVAGYVIWRGQNLIYRAAGDDAPRLAAPPAWSSPTGTAANGGTVTANGAPTATVGRHRRPEPDDGSPVLGS
jgi:hypothetical protein